MGEMRAPAGGNGSGGAHTERERHGLEAGPYVKLGEDVLHMRADGVGREEHPLGDRRSVQPIGHHVQDAALSWSEPAETFLVLVDQAAGRQEVAQHPG